MSMKKHIFISPVNYEINRYIRDSHYPHQMSQMPAKASCLIHPMSPVILHYPRFCQAQVAYPIQSKMHFICQFAGPRSIPIAVLRGRLKDKGLKDVRNTFYHIKLGLKLSNCGL